MSCLKKTWWITALLTASFAVLSFIFFSVTYVPMYRSNVRFTITPLISSDSSSGNSVYKFNYNATLATQMAATFPYIINSGVMSDIIANEIGRPVSGRVTSNAVADTNIFEIDVTSRSADDAYDIINSVMLNYPKIAEYVIGDTRMNVIEGSEPELATEPYNTGYYYKYVVLFALAGMAAGLLINYFYMKSKKRSCRDTILKKRSAADVSARYRMFRKSARLRHFRSPRRPRRLQDFPSRCGC